MFEKGKSGNPNGRPQGSLNKATINYLDFQLWFGKIAKDLEEIKEPEKRIAIEVQVIDRMLSKVANLPGTPVQSVENVDKMIEAYEQQKTENVNA